MDKKTREFIIIPLLLLGIYIHRSSDWKLIIFLVYISVIIDNYTLGCTNLHSFRYQITYYGSLTAQ